MPLSQPSSARYTQKKAARAKDYAHAFNIHYGLTGDSGPRNNGQKRRLFQQWPQVWNKDGTRKQVSALCKSLDSLTEPFLANTWTAVGALLQGGGASGPSPPCKSLTHSVQSKLIAVQPV